MAKARSPSRDRAYELWQSSGGKMQLKEIADQLNIPVGTIRAWKKRDDWDVALQKPYCNATQDKCNATRNDRAPDGKFLPGNQISAGFGAPPGNNNGLGNNGGAPQGNQNKTIHGLYSKYLPKETRKIASDISGLSAVDILWSNICIKYAAILRAQKIMYVKGKGEIVDQVKSESENSTTYELQYAWDRQARFLNAESTAMQALTKMIKQYDELCRSDLTTEEQRLRIAKLKSDIAVNEAKVDSKDDDMDDSASYKTALMGQVDKVWGDG